MPSDARLHGFLTAVLRADAVPHGARSLYDHLAGTADYLQRWSNPPDICRAGLFHSIYGTGHFRHGMVPFRQRRLIRSLIGARAEQLAYLFCVTERPWPLIAQWPCSVIVIADRHRRDLAVLNRMDLRALLEIEAANLLDQQPERHDCLPQLAALPLSAGAQAALRAALQAVA